MRDIKSLRPDMGSMLATLGGLDVLVFTGELASIRRKFDRRSVTPSVS